MAIVLCVLAMSPLGANALVRWVEGPTPAPDACASNPTLPIVVLAAGLQHPARREDDFLSLDGPGVRRVFGLLDSGLSTPGRKVVIIGGGESLGQSAVMAELAVRLGVPRDVVTIGPLSRTTWENAAEVVERNLAPEGRVALLTSALHMRRAAFAFERHGIEACRYPVDSRYIAFGGIGGIGSIGYLVPQHSATSKAEAALHELAGLLAYRFK